MNRLELTWATLPIKVLDDLIIEQNTKLDKAREGGQFNGEVEQMEAILVKLKEYKILALQLEQAKEKADKRIQNKVEKEPKERAQ